MDSEAMKVSWFDRATEQLVSAWRQRYIDGRCDLGEFEAGVERALSAVATKDDWRIREHEEQIRAFCEPRGGPFLGPIRPLENPAVLELEERVNAYRS